MPKTRPAYPVEFRRQMVELVRAGRDPMDLAREFEPARQTIQNWVAEADGTCFSSVESGLVGDAPLELGGACEAQRRMTAAGIVEAIDVTGQRVDGLCARLERRAPDQLALQRFEGNYPGL